MKNSIRETQLQEKRTFLKSVLQAVLFVFIITSIIIGVIVGLCFFTHSKPQFSVDYFKTHPNENFKQIDKAYALIISFSLLIFYIMILTSFYKKRNHYLINYRPLVLCALTGICGGVYNVILPILITFQTGGNNSNKWIITLIFTIIFATMNMMANISRYFKLYLLSKRDIGKMKLYNDNYDLAFPGNEENANNFEPNTYLKRLNKLVSKRITIIFFVIPYTLLISLGLAISIFSVKKQSIDGIRENALYFYSPIILLTTVTLFIIPFFYIELSKSKSINWVNKLDMISNYTFLFLGTFLFIGSLFAFYDKRISIGVDDKGKEQYIYHYSFEYLIKLKSTSLFFIIPSFGSSACAIVIPLIEAYMADRKLKSKKFLGKREFTHLLVGSSYIDSLKSVAVKSYCVETVIFWEMHVKLMKLVSDSLVSKHRLSIDQHSSQTKDFSKLNNRTSYTPSNYDLLLGLNKNIFGSGNNEILYTGSFGEDKIDSKLVNAISHGISSKNKGDSFFSSNNRNRSISDSRINSSDYMNNNLSSSFNSNRSYPNCHTTNNNYFFNENRQRNNSVLSQFTINSINQNYNNYYIDVSNNDKVELLKNHDILYPSREIGNNTNSYSNSRNNLVNNASRHRRNTIKNRETEIFYEIFNVDSVNNEVPQKYWKDFDNLYNSFISDQSLATVNLDTNTIIKLRRAITSKDYTMDMFFPALAETVELIYQNLYPKLLAEKTK
ncbi:hypothetical protein BCR36DRAFT_415535 [Piromyces finnis]|uniref:RGS domain-containing protein n=1 Tax=Piromyces finnis TaxID=1754191 RepID=A0A1Y1UZQ5_9FUNG|nr:hypothetical protein BCR36DRAFT_415535 [Piromyces finnis]|eukprot:ORX43523.1 hypothetical protein BCR36DRAFT_415535 [Piromyces finnis]